MGACLTKPGRIPCLFVALEGAPGVWTRRRGSTLTVSARSLGLLRWHGAMPKLNAECISEQNYLGWLPASLKQVLVLDAGQARGRGCRTRPLAPGHVFQSK